MEQWPAATTTKRLLFSASPFSLSLSPLRDRRAIFYFNPNRKKREKTDVILGKHHRATHKPDTERHTIFFSAAILLMVSGCVWAICYVELMPAIFFSPDNQPAVGSPRTPVRVHSRCEHGFWLHASDFIRSPKIHTRSEFHKFRPKYVCLCGTSLSSSIVYISIFSLLAELREKKPSWKPTAAVVATYSGLHSSTCIWGEMENDMTITGNKNRISNRVMVDFAAPMCILCVCTQQACELGFALLLFHYRTISYFGR